MVVVVVVRELQQKLSGPGLRYRKVTRYAKPLIDGGGCVGGTSVGVAWFHVYIHFAADNQRRNKACNGSKDGKRDILQFEPLQNYCKKRSGGHVVCIYC